LRSALELAPTTATPSSLLHLSDACKQKRESFVLPHTAFDMERRSRSWAIGLSFLGFFALLFSLGFVQQVKADDVSEYGTVIGIVRVLPAPFNDLCKQN
jgi:hypothetical protein